MAVIEPFRGIRYNPEHVGDLSRVMAPPYDIIPPHLQERLYQGHPNNVIRLELNRETPRDRPGENRYTRAAAHLQEWLRQGILIREQEPVIYVYYIDYRDARGRSKTLKGFLARLRLESFESGLVLPHENTLAGPKADRLKLMEACHANFSPIFSLYTNPVREITPFLDEAAAVRPLVQVRDPEGAEHRLWAIAEPAVIRRIQDVIASHPLFIADGHHRYETALAYRDAMREKSGIRDGHQGFDHVMTYISNMEEPGLTIYPTHRLIHGLGGFRLDRYLQEVKAYFQVEVFPFLRKTRFLEALDSRQTEACAFGLYTSESDDLFLLTLRERQAIEGLFPASVSPVLRGLDVTILHTVLLDHLLGIGEKELKAQSHVRYVKAREDALHAVNDGDAQLAFLLNATRMDQLREVSLQREKMPQKSTYFYPKLLTGLVLNSLD